MHGVCRVRQLGGRRSRELVGRQSGFACELVGVGRGKKERGEHGHMKKTQHHRPFMMSERTGRRGSKCASPEPCASAPVRSAARNLAERARGFSWVSASSAMTGLRVNTVKLGAACATSGACREPPPMRLRSAKKVFTMRSSGE